MADSGKKVDELQKGISETSGSLQNLGVSLKTIAPLLTSFNQAFNQTISELTSAGKGLDALTKKMGLASDTVKRAKRGFEKTWTDVANDKINNDLKKQVRTLEDLAVGTEKFNQRVRQLKDSTKSGLINQNALEDQSEMIESIERRLAKFKGTLNSIGTTKLGLSLGATEAAKHLTEAETKIKAIRLQSIMAAKSLQDGFDIDLDPMTEAIEQAIPGFKKMWQQVDADAKKHFAQIKSYVTESFTLPKGINDEKIKALSGGQFGSREDFNTAANDPSHKQHDMAMKVAEASALTLDVGLKVADNAPDELQAELAAVIARSNELGEPLEKTYILMQHQVQTVHDLEKAQKSVNNAMAQEQKMSKGLAEDAMTRKKNMWAGMAQGGWKGGVTAYAKSFEDARKAIMGSDLKSGDKVERLQKLGYHAEAAEDGSISYQAKGVNKIAQSISGMISGIPGLGKGVGILGEGGSLVEAGEALGGLTSAAGGAAGGLGGVTAMLGPFGIALAAIIALFKIYAAAVDKTAKDYRQVKAFGGVSAIGAGKNGMLNLHDETYNFRKGLVSGGGSGLDSYYLTLEKRMDILQAAQASGLNAGRMQTDIKKGSFQFADAERWNATAKYLQVSAEMSELLGKDLKEAAAEVTNIHEELSMSFEGVEKFFINITRSAVAAGISNDKFIKLTRTLANEQVNYGTQLQATSKILEQLGASGAYTSETIKKAFEGIVPNQQTIEQRVVGVRGIMGDRQVLANEEADLKRQQTELAEWERKRDEAAANGQSTAEAEKEIAGRRIALQKKMSFVEGLRNNNAYQVGAANDVATPTTLIREALRSDVMKIGAAGVLSKGQKGGSIEEMTEEWKHVNYDILEKLQNTYGIKNADQMPQTMLKMLEGGQKTLVDSLFDANGNKQELDDQTKAELNKALQAIGINLTAEQAQAQGVKAFKDTLKSTGSKDKFTFEQALKMSEATKNLGKVTTSMEDSIKANLAASADRSTDMADKMKKWMEPMMEQANSFLDALVQGSKDSREYYNNLQKRRFEGEQQATLDKAQATESQAQNAFDDIAIKSGLTPTAADKEKQMADIRTRMQAIDKQVQEIGPMKMGKGEEGKNVQRAKLESEKYGLEEQLKKLEGDSKGNNQTTIGMFTKLLAQQKADLAKDPQNADLKARVADTSSKLKTLIKLNQDVEAARSVRANTSTDSKNIDFLKEHMGVDGAKAGSIRKGIEAMYLAHSANLDDLIQKHGYAQQLKDKNGNLLTDASGQALSTFNTDSFKTPESAARFAEKFKADVKSVYGDKMSPETQTSLVAMFQKVMESMSDTEEKRNLGAALQSLTTNTNIFNGVSAQQVKLLADSATTAKSS